MVNQMVERTTTTTDAESNTINSNNKQSVCIGIL